jgi:flagellar export protein FliJ
MAPFRFRLSTLLRLRENLRDECRQQLSAAQRAEDIVAARIAELDGELGGLRQHCQRVSRPGPINVDRLLEAGRYEMTLRAEQQAAQTQRATVSAEVERRRESLVEADRGVKTLEKLEEQQRTRHRFEDSRRDIKQLDAMALQLQAAQEEA